MTAVKASVADSTTPAASLERPRIPFSTPTLRLAVPDIPGYHLHWFRDEPARIERAQQAGYEFVDRGEIKVNHRDSLGSDPASDGNSDLGSRVSVIAGAELGKDGQPGRLILMKIKEEWWKEDQEKQTGPGSRLDGVRKSVLKGLLGQEGASPSDREQIYVDDKKTKIPDFFKRRG